MIITLHPTTGNILSQLPDDTELQNNTNIVIIPNSIDYKTIYEDKYPDIISVTGLPNPLTVLTGDDLLAVQQATETYKLRQQIYNDKSLKSQVGILNDIVMLLIASQVEQFTITSTATDFNDVKTKLLASQLKSLVSVFELVAPQLPPQIKDGGIIEVAKKYLEFQDRVAELFKK